jgi:hypothetical protein
MPKVAQVVVCSQINTKEINTEWAERKIVELLFIKTQSVPRCKHFSTRL